MSSQRMLVVVRHGRTPHNEKIEKRGHARLTKILQRASAQGMDEKDLMILLQKKLKRSPRAEARVPIVRERGGAQCEAVKQSFDNGGLAFKACLRSPSRRTAQTAKLIVGRSLECRTFEGLYERDLGVFHHLHRDLFYDFFPEEAREKAKDPLGWKPFGGSSLRELWPGFQPAIKTACEIVRAGDNVLIVAHADVNVSLRALPELGGMTTAQLLRKGPGGWNPLWFQNCQYDRYSFGDPRGGRPWDVPTHFRSVVPYGKELGGTRLDTGWWEIKR